jgi:hypothetical protein
VLVPSGQRREITLTLEAAIELTNYVGDMTDAGVPASPDEVRRLLVDQGFVRAHEASAAALGRLTDRLGEVAALYTSLPDVSVDDVVEAINRHLAAMSIRPSLTAHDGAGLHIHWTPRRATFDDQVIADLVMALGQEVCDNGLDRFGRCAAADCDHVFYDATRNRSRRFCPDPRCASRTHTAEHRARRRDRRG